MEIFLFCRGVHLSGSPISSPNDAWGDLRACDREFLLQTQRVQAYSDEIGQNHPELLSHRLSLLSSDHFPMNLDRP